MVASVPEFTSRNCSMPFIRAMTSSANSNSRLVGAPKPVPSGTAFTSASTTARGVCPRINGPQAQT